MRQCWKASPKAVPDFSAQQQCGGRGGWNDESSTVNTRPLGFDGDSVPPCEPV
jgi:hypothetical protein